MNYEPDATRAVVFAARLRNLFAECLLGRTQVLGLRDRRTSVDVSGHGDIHDVFGFPSGTLRNLEKCRIVSEQLRVDHHSSLLSNAVA